MTQYCKAKASGSFMWSFCDLFYGDAIISDCVVPSGSMIGEYEMGTIWKEVVVA
jgi:hypothetical protein